MKRDDNIRNILNYFFKEGVLKIRYYIICFLIFSVYILKDISRTLGWESIFDFLESPNEILTIILGTAVILIINVNIQNDFARDMNGKDYERAFEDGAFDNFIDKISPYCYTSIAEDKRLPFDSEKYKKSKGELCNCISIAFDHSKVSKMNNTKIEEMAKYLKEQIPNKFFRDEKELVIEECKLSNRSRVCYQAALMNIANQNYGASMHEIHDFIYGFGKELETEMNDLEWMMLEQLVSLILD